MKAINCRDIGVECGFEARCETIEEVLQKCQDHASTDHGMTEIPPDLQARVKAAIREEPTTLRAGG